MGGEYGSTTSVYVKILLDMQWMPVSQVAKGGCLKKNQIISLSSTLRSLFGHRNLQRACILHKDYVSKKNFLIELYQDRPDAVFPQIEVFLLTVSVVSPKPGRFLSNKIYRHTNGHCIQLLVRES